MDKGEEHNFILNEDGLQSKRYAMANCREVLIYENSRDAEDRYNARILFYDE